MEDDSGDAGEAAMATWEKALTALAVVVAAFAFVNFIVFVTAGAPLGVPIVVSHPIGIVAMGYLVIRHMLPRALGGRDHSAAVAANLPPAGTTLASAWCSGQIGPVSFGNTLRVSVHADRIVLKPLFAARRTIMAAEITGLSTGGGLAFGGPALTIDHVAPGVRSPLVLLLTRNNPVRQAIADLHREPQDRPAAAAPPERAGGWTDGWSLLALGQLAFGLVFAGLGCFLLIRSPDIFPVLLIVFGGLIAVQAVARARHRRRHRLSP
jgi:hypothetical protein